MHTVYKLPELDARVAELLTGPAIKDLDLIKLALDRAYSRIRRILVIWNKINSRNIGAAYRDWMRSDAYILSESVISSIIEFVFQIESILRYVFEPLPITPEEQHFVYNHVRSKLVLLLSELGVPHRPNPTSSNDLDLNLKSIGNLVVTCYLRHYSERRLAKTVTYTIPNNEDLRKNLFKQLPYDIFSEDRLPEKYRKVEDDIVDIFNHIVESANMLRERCPSSNIENLLLDVVFKDR